MRSTRLFVGVLLISLLCACPEPPGFGDLKDAYIREWARFYPSQAFAMGDKGSAFQYEDFTPGNIDDWIRYNRLTVNTTQILKDFTPDDQMDFRLLVKQAQKELDRWETDPAYIQSPPFYAGMISQSFTHLLVREDFSNEERYKAAIARLDGVENLCNQALFNLKNGRPVTTTSALANLRRSADFIENKLPEIGRSWVEDASIFEASCVQTAKKVKELALYVETEILPAASKPDAYGKSEYERKLRAYVHPDLSPDQLAKGASEEMDVVRKLMEEEAAAWWRETRSEDFVADNALSQALEAMEADRVDSSADILTSFTQLTHEIEDFIREKGLATLADEQTLFIDLSPPHFSGAAVGGVYPAGPFNPEARTLFYLPSVPDDAPEKTREGFYRSFNNHFNAMIIAHEMIPGHYHQFKVATANPRLVRTLFADGSNVEGWGTFCEELALDAGWRDGNRLTRLAHLRKRMENAVRAYVSVMVHCEGMNQEAMTQFAVEKGMLPPQFAANLWSRVMNSPLQLPTYYLGSKDFRKLYQDEQTRLGDQFSTRDFCDKILAAGAVFVEDLPQVLK